MLADLPTLPAVPKALRHDGPVPVLVVQLIRVAIRAVPEIQGPAAAHAAREIEPRAGRVIPEYAAERVVDGEVLVEAGGRTVAVVGRGGDEGAAEGAVGDGGAVAPVAGADVGG
jgi:hypothetical protein